MGARFPVMLRKMWSGGEVQAWIDENMGDIPMRLTDAEIAQIIQDKTGCADSDSVYAAVAVRKALEG